MYSIMGTHLESRPPAWGGRARILFQAEGLPKCGKVQEPRADAENELAAADLADRRRTRCQRRNGPVADRDDRHARSNAAGYHVRAGDRPLGTDLHRVAVNASVGPHALIAEASGVPAELAVLIPRQLKAPIEPDSNLHAHHP